MKLYINKKRIISTILLIILFLNPVLAIPDVYHSGQESINITLGDEYLYYPFYEGTGTSIDDIGSGDNDGTLTDGRWDDGIYDYSIYFIDDDNNDNVNAGNINLTDMNNYTLNFWFSINSTDYNSRTRTHRIIYSDMGGGYHYTVFIQDFEDGSGGEYLYMKYKNEAGIWENVHLGWGLDEYVDDELHMMTITHNINDGNVYCYIDGADERSETGRTLMNTMDDDMYLGGHIGSFNWYGKLDEFRIYDRIINDDEVQQLYSGYYNYNPTIIYDVSTNQEHIYEYNTEIYMNFTTEMNTTGCQTLNFTCEDIGITDYVMNCNEQNQSYIILKDNTTYDENFNYSFMIEDYYDENTNLSDMMFSINEPVFHYWNWVENIKQNQYLQDIQNKVNNISNTAQNTYNYIGCGIGILNQTSETCLNILEQQVNQTLDIENHEYKIIKIIDYVRTKLNNYGCQDIDLEADEEYIMTPLRNEDRDLCFLDYTDFSIRWAWTNTKNFFLKPTICFLTTQYFTYEEIEE